MSTPIQDFGIQLYADFPDGTPYTDYQGASQTSQQLQNGVPPIGAVAPVFNTTVRGFMTLGVYVTFHNASSKPIALQLFNKPSNPANPSIPFSNGTVFLTRNDDLVSPIANTQQFIATAATTIFDPAVALVQNVTINTNNILATWFLSFNAYSVGGNPVAGDSIIVVVQA